MEQYPPYPISQPTVPAVDWRSGSGLGLVISIDSWPKSLSQSLEPPVASDKCGYHRGAG